MRISGFNKSVIVALLVGAALTSCDMRKKFREEEQAKIEDFLAKNPNLAFQKKASGLYYLDVVVGSGPQAETGDSAFVFYNLKLLDGQLFETNIGSTDTVAFPVNLGKLAVKGFDEGVTYMREGGQSMLLVPSSLAFGEVGTVNQSISIGGYEPILFDIYLVRLKKNSAR
jgi:FKBP-type peptidyl-prolyl cis-trans isomerase FkpA